MRFFHRSANRGDHPSNSQIVCILCPGSIETSGGIGRAMSYIMEQWPSLEAAPRLKFINTRGSFHIAFSPFFFLLALAQITGLALTGRILLLHINVSANGSALRKFVVVALASLLRLRIILQSHSDRLDGFYLGLPHPAQAALRWMFGRADCVVVLGEVWKRVVVEHLRVPPERIEIVCNGVPAPSPRPPSHDPSPQGRSIALSQPSRLHIAFLGRLGVRKGVPELLAALASERLAPLDWHATLAGDGDAAGYRKTADELGIARRITFPGWLGKPAVERLLGEADILVLASHSEGLPMAVLEALANGVAVICTPVGSLAEFLVDQHSVLFVPPGDVEALVAALARLLASPDLRAHLADAGRAAFHEHFEVDAVARTFLRIYRRVGATRDVPRRRDAAPALHATKPKGAIGQ